MTDKHTDQESIAAYDAKILREIENKLEAVGSDLIEAIDGLIAARTGHQPVPETHESVNGGSGPRRIWASVARHGGGYWHEHQTAYDLDGRSGPWCEYVRADLAAKNTESRSKPLPEPELVHARINPVYISTVLRGLIATGDRELLATGAEGLAHRMDEIAEARSRGSEPQPAPRTLEERVAEAEAEIATWPAWKKEAANRVFLDDDAPAIECKSVARDPYAWLIEHDGISTATCSAKIAKTASRDGGTVRPLYLADDMECRSDDEARRLVAQALARCGADEVGALLQEAIRAMDCGSNTEGGEG